MKTFNSSMPRFCLALAAGIAMVSLIGLAQAPADGPDAFPVPCLRLLLHAQPCTFTLSA